MENVVTLTDIETLFFNHKSFGGRKLVLLTSSDLELIKAAYDSPLIRKITSTAVIFHPVMAVGTKNIKYFIDQVGED